MKIRKLSTALIFSMFTWLSIFAQQKDPTLFTVAGEAVPLSEFKYIYSKTNGNKADFSEASLEEYLDLYIKFKLKVKKAKELKMDTIKQLQTELAGYRRQLADSYLINKEVTDQLTKEAYDRKQQDVNISHIFFRVPTTAGPIDTVAPYQKAMEIKKRLDAGGDFEKLARQFSDDKTASKNGGQLGFVSALFPKGYYALETAAYEQPIGVVAGPIRTGNGYHLLKVHERRPARGEVEAAHILLRTQQQIPAEVKAKIDGIYEELKNGASFEDLAKKNSEDGRTAEKGGYIGFVSINRFELAFEDAVFAVPADGSFSKPFQSSLGWHIVKRISKKEMKTYEEAKSALEASVKRDARFEASQIAMIENIKRSANYQDYPLVLKKFISMQNDTFFTFRWKAPKPRSKEVLFNLDNKKYTLGDFADYLVKSTRERMRLKGRETVSASVQQLFESFVDDRCMAFEERQLEDKYPEFKSLMREYEEGILLFEVTKMKVWDKAAQDTAGLNAFYPTVEDKYKWAERAITTKYTVNQRAKSLLEPIREFAKTHSKEDVLARFSKNTIQSKQETFEKGKGDELNVKEWKVGEMSTTFLDPEKGEYSFYKVEAVVPSRKKELNEARGYIIADYQDYLEKQWVEELRKQFKVEVNRTVLEQLIKS